MVVHWLWRVVFPVDTNLHWFSDVLGLVLCENKMDITKRMIQMSYTKNNTVEPVCVHEI